ncbi:MAG: hypothetical protein KBT82_17610 [Marinobacter sp.]|uniref:hypothetical protein n=1 Tax=Marinobacter sp. TaxID=50741 RepID=UPI001B496695|nr:hypothetical protein [Marinobacter sp.]MBQ0748503.1 hypothetical protein [Marinobacter sp.]MBQ0815963.1 hypothetical protein [Marinobacter sp.]
MEKSQSLKVDKILIELLREQSGTPFSTTDLRDLYIHQISDAQRPGGNQLRKYIYKELLRLESARLVKRHGGSAGRGCQFIFCPEHSCFEIEAKPSPFGYSDPNVESTMDVETQRALKEELSQRRVELVASIGEAEEYQRLYNKYPALRGAVKEQYLESRERSTKLLGQLRAVETVITQISLPS